MAIKLTDRQLLALPEARRKRIESVRACRERKRARENEDARQDIAAYNTNQPDLPPDLLAFVPEHYRAKHGRRCQWIYAKLAAAFIKAGRPLSQDVNGPLILIYSLAVETIEARDIKKVRARTISQVLHLWKVLRLGELPPDPPRKPRAVDRFRW